MKLIIIFLCQLSGKAKTRCIMKIRHNGIHNGKKNFGIVIKGR